MMEQGTARDWAPRLRYCDALHERGNLELRAWFEVPSISNIYHLYKRFEINK